MISIRNSGRLGLALAVLVLAAHSAVAFGGLPENLPEDPLPPTRDIPNRTVELLRSVGRYQEALAVAEARLDELTGWAPPASITAVADQVRSLRGIVRLSEELRAELTVADSLAVAVKVAWVEGRFAQGTVAAQRCLEIRRRVLGERHLETIQSLHDLATFLFFEGKSDQAEALYREALDLRLETLGREHLAVAETLHFLGELLFTMGRYVEAEEVLSEGLEVRRAVLGEDHDDVDRDVIEIAQIHMRHGDYASAEPMLREALVRSRNRRGEDHWLNATLMENLATVAEERGDHVTAESLCREVLALRRRVLDLEHPHIARSIRSLGTTLARQERFDEAEPLLREALDLHRRFQGDDSPEAIESTKALASLLRDKGDHTEAESLYRRALDIDRQMLGNEHPDVAADLLELARLHQVRGETAQAEGLLVEALLICRGALGEEHPMMAALQYELAKCELADRELEVAEARLAHAAEIFEIARRRIGSGISRATFQTSPYANLAAARLALGRPHEAWIAVESAQGRVLADLLMVAGRRSLDSFAVRTQDSLRSQLSRFEKQLLALQDAARDRQAEDFQGLDETQKSQELRDIQVRIERTRTRLLEAEVAWARFQRDIAARHPVSEGQAFSIDRIQAALREDTAIVGWLEDPWGLSEAGPWAYVLRDQGPVTWIPLGILPGSEPRTVRGTREFRDELTLAATWPLRVTSVEGTEAEAHRLWIDWFAPVLARLNGIENLVVIPSGPMTATPVEALVDAQGRYLVDEFAISYAPSATIYAWLHEHETASRPRLRRALLVGDPPFNEDQRLGMELEAKTPSELPGAGSVDLPLDVGALRGALAGNEASLTRLPRLPRTRAEVDIVSSFFEDVTMLVGAAATEQKLAELADADALGRFDAIHLATHALVDDVHPDRSALVLARTELPDPIEAIRTGQRIFDGLLTAGEIVADWRLDAELVTLSGCQTALGKEAAGEGYFGLAHAFLQAGTRSLLVSLWAVEDEATALLMARFYQNLVRDHRQESETLSKARALQEAKRWLRSHTDGAGNQPFRHPAYWSGFVLVGEP